MNNEYVRTDLKIKQPDGSFVKYSPTVTLDSVINDDGTSIRDKFVENDDVVVDPEPNKIIKLNNEGKIPETAIPQNVVFTTFTLDDI